MVITEKNNLGDLLKYELDKNYCREVSIIAAGQNLVAGTVLGLSNGKYTANLKTASNDTLESGDSPSPSNADSVCACAVLLEDCDTSSGDKEALVLKRISIVNVGNLIFPNEATDEDKEKYIEDLYRSGILVRKSC